MSIGMKKVVARIARNQKIHCQPAYCESTPPIIGPIDGARIPVSDVMPMYWPRSAEVTMSATIELAMATVPLEPADWTMRRIKSAV